MVRSESSPLLEAKNLECQRGESILFQNLSLAVGAGEILQIEGANGSGKTSLLRILAGLSPAGDGTLSWRGQIVTQSRRAFFHAETAYLGHHLGLKADLTVGENLRLAAALRGRPANTRSMLTALDLVAMTERADLPVRALSAGQRQRVALARLLGAGATLWILDEPFTALDAAGIDLIRSLLESHAAQGGLAILSSHHPIAIGERLRTLCLQ